MLFNSQLFFNTNASRQPSRGFGLIELMVSISIMTLVSTVILVKNRSFNNALLLRNQAYEIAFSLRQVQLLAVSTNAKEAGTRKNQYGVHFVTGSSTYRMFRDNQGAIGWYDDASDTVILPVGSLDNRFIIADITNSGGTSLAGDELSITFVRPNFDGLFKTDSLTSVSGPIRIVITPRDSTGYSVVPSRVVEVTSTGQISVK